MCLLLYLDSIDKSSVIGNNFLYPINKRYSKILLKRYVVLHTVCVYQSVR